MSSTITTSLLNLKTYIEKESYKGWDPYDGLNSKLFKSTPFRHSAIARLVIIQLFKRNPVNLRRLALISKEYNSKGIGLILSGYCNLLKYAKYTKDETFGSEKALKSQIVELANLLIDLKCEGYSGSCWGYNFDWQARRLFLFPKNTPTVVATSFCASALFEAYEATLDQRYLNIALSSADFIINDLNRHYINEGFLVSYSPLHGNNTVINASLLGAKTLIQCYKYSNKANYFELAQSLIDTCIKLQQDDGSWIYGLLPSQNWIDSYHTGYNLDALSTYYRISKDNSVLDSIKRGYKYYIDNFFEKDGVPIHFKHSKYPIDIHCPGQLFVVNHKLRITDSKLKSLESKVLSWSITNMQSKDGYFYYQIKQFLSSKISYMRWSNAFMFNSISLYLISNFSEDESLV